jgi:uncharacterized protein YjbI with pentapeptide repeats
MSTYVWISRKQLTDGDACDAGLALFDAIAREQGRKSKVRIRWDALSYVWLESSGRRFASWMFVRGIVPMPNLRGADLRGADLRGADLRGADLRGAHLGGADLRGANLRGAHLGGADLRGAHLGGADLGGWERSDDGFARRKQ